MRSSGRSKALLAAWALCSCAACISVGGGGPKGLSTPAPVVQKEDPVKEIGIAELAFDVAKLQLYVLKHMPQDEQDALGAEAYGKEIDRLTGVVEKRKANLQRLYEQYGETLPR